MVNLGNIDNKIKEKREREKQKLKNKKYGILKLRKKRDQSYLFK